MKPIEEAACRRWIQRHIVPSRTINHIFASKTLYRMFLKDTNIAGVTHRDFKEMMLGEGHVPADVFADNWEFRISSAPLRRRSNASAGGWQPSRNPYLLSRMR